MSKLRVQDSLDLDQMSGLIWIVRLEGYMVLFTINRDQGKWRRSDEDKPGCLGLARKVKMRLQNPLLVSCLINANALLRRACIVLR